MTGVPHRSQPRSADVRHGRHPSTFNALANALADRSGHPASSARSSYIARSCAPVNRPTKASENVATAASPGPLGGACTRRLGASSGASRTVTASVEWQWGQVTVSTPMTLNDTIKMCHLSPLVGQPVTPPTVTLPLPKPQTVTGVTGVPNTPPRPTRDTSDRPPINPLHARARTRTQEELTNDPSRPSRKATP